MRNFILICLACIIAQQIFAETTRPEPQPTNTSASIKTDQAIENGLITKKYLDSLTEDDVPKKWKTRVEKSHKNNCQLITYFRGEKKVLTVSWMDDWTGKRAKMFTASVFDGDTRISKIFNLGDNTCVTQPQTDEDYTQYVAISDDKKISVMIQGDNEFFETIIVDGRDTHLIDDLEYTKIFILLDEVVTPLIDSIHEHLDISDESTEKDNADILIFDGTVEKIETSPVSKSRENFIITMRVDRVISTGTGFSGETFQFRIHSPAIKQIAVGDRQRITATRSEKGYSVEKVDAMPNEENQNDSSATK